MECGKAFAVAAHSDVISTRLFYAVTLVSFVLIAFPGPLLASILHPILAVAAFGSIICTTITSIYQTHGNRLLRVSQLSESLGARIGDKPRPGYYNNSLPPSFTRLAASTLENTLFTREVLIEMLKAERIKIVVYAGIVVYLMACRWTATEWMLALAQLLFSADVLLAWIRMERFLYRTAKVHDALKQFFQQRGDVTSPNGLAIAINAFTDYECAKDEASIVMDSTIFKRLNPELSKRWNELRIQLGIE